MTETEILKGDPEDLVIPDGTVVITFGISGATPMACFIDADRAFEVAEIVDKHLSARGSEYLDVVHTIAQRFRKADRTGDDSILDGMSFYALWTILYSGTGHDTPGQLREALAKDGKAHFTWRYTDTDFAYALTPHYVDLFTPEHMATMTPMTAPERPVVLDGKGRRDGTHRTHRVPSRRK